MRELAAVKMTEQRSRFFAHLYLLDNPDQEAEILKEHRRKYRKARHHCHALRFGGVERARDDGEVGHPGKALLELLRKHEMDSHMLVVSRVFGGIKLGVGGVTRAFRAAGQAAIDGWLAENPGE